MDYFDRTYRDRLSGDLLLTLPWDDPSMARRCRESMDGMVLEVETQIVGYFRLHGEKEGPEGEPVIDVVSKNHLSGLRIPVNNTDVRRLLSAYHTNLIPKLDREKAERFEAKIGEFADFVAGELEHMAVFVGVHALSSELGKGLPVFAHFKNGKDAAPTLLYLAYGLEVEERWNPPFHVRWRDSIASLH